MGKSTKDIQGCVPGQCYGQTSEEKMPEAWNAKHVPDFPKGQPPPFGKGNEVPTGLANTSPSMVNDDMKGLRK